MTPRFVLAGVAALALSASTPLAASAASRSADDSGKAAVVDTETVQAYLDATGAVQSQRVYEQLVVRGSGSVTVTNPVSTHGLRNLDGFGGFEVRDGAQVATYDLDAADGVVRERTVSDHEADLPLTVSVRYLLDDEEVEPGDVVGASGHLRVEYTVKNTTARTQEVEIPDGRGGTTTRDVPVAVPYAGTLTTTLPESFTDVSSERGNLAGDGRGGTKVNFTMTLFPPIGSPKTTLAYEADITDGVVPRAEVSALPVNPMESPTFATAADGYRNGTASGVTLADGAREMDANLLKLRDGAQDLLGGLVQLHEGAGRLRDGLTDKAVPGARKLAAGAGDLGAGMTKIADGTDKAAGGSRDLRDGLARISDGLGQLADVDGLPEAADGAAKLKVGVDQVLAGFGAVGSTETLLDGLSRLETGLGQLSAGLQQLKGDGSTATPGLVGAKGGVDQSKSGVDQSKAGVDQVIAGLTDAVGTGGSIDQLLGGLQLLTTLDCGPTCLGVVTTKLIPGVQDSKTKLTDARNGLTQVTGGLGQVSGGLGQVSGGLAQAIGGLQTQLIPGAQQAASGATKANAGAQKLAGGLRKIRKGLADLETGLTGAVAGVLALDDGAGTAYAGAGDLAAGLGLLDEGAATARDGSSRLAAGNKELATKLEDAADGSDQLADGLGEARGGAPKIVDGAGRLSKEGAQVIADKGSATAQDYGELVAVMEAGGKRADAEQMAYGAPDGALGLTAYNLVIEGEDGAGSRNLARGLAGGGLLAAAAGIGFLRRRLL